MEENQAYLWIPYLACRHADTSNPRCNPIRLPYSNLKALTGNEEIPEEETYPPDWPEDGWTAFFGCSSCGYLSQYTSSDVRWTVESKLAPGRFHSGANCFCVEFECAQRNCKTPIKLHIEKSGTTEKEIIALLQVPFFIGSLPCGHSFTTLPTAELRIQRIMDKIE